MITATWCENRALIVGIPRRITEWSTESSCTRVARWISSTTAASVTVRASSAPDARWLRRSRVGRNSLPFMQQMFVDFGDNGEVRGDDAAELLGHELQLARHGPLDVPQRNRGELLAHVISLWRAPGTARRRL